MRQVITSETALCEGMAQRQICNFWPLSALYREQPAQMAHEFRM